MDGPRARPTSWAETAAEQLLARATPVAHRVCRGEARSLPPSQVDELVQDTLETVWRRLPTFAGQSPFEAWVRGIARRVCSNARRRHADVLTRDGMLDAMCQEPDALHALQRHERIRVVQHAMAAMADFTARDVLVHRYVEDLDRDEIAARVGLDGAEAVRAVVQRAARQLRARIQARLVELGDGGLLDLS